MGSRACPMWSSQSRRSSSRTAARAATVPSTPSRPSASRSSREPTASNTRRRAHRRQGPRHPARERAVGDDRRRVTARAGRVPPHSDGRRPYPHQLVHGGPDPGRDPDTARPRADAPDPSRERRARRCLRRRDLRGGAGPGSASPCWCRGRRTGGSSGRRRSSGTPLRPVSGCTAGPSATRTPSFRPTCATARRRGRTATQWPSTRCSSRSAWVRCSRTTRTPLSRPVKPSGPLSDASPPRPCRTPCGTG